MSFVNPLLLLLVVAVGLPALFHLLRRRKVVPKLWGAFRLLFEVEARSRRAKIDKLLLLLVRMAIILLFVLAFARPAGYMGLLAGEGGGDKHVVVLQDVSASLGRRAGDLTLFDKAQERIGTHLKRLRFDRAALVRMSDGPVEAFSGFTSHGALVREAVEEAELGSGGTDVVASLRHAAQLLRREEAEGGVILVYHDFHASAWDLEELARFNSEIADLDLDIGLVHLKPPDELPDDQAVESLEWSADVLSPGMEALLSVELVNHFDEPRERTLTLSVDGANRHEQEIELPAATDDGPGRERVVLRVPLATAGAHSGTVSLSPDALPANSSRHFAVQLVPTIKVLLVDGFPDLDASRSDAYFPSRLLQTEVTGNISSKVIPGWELQKQDLDAFDVVALLNVNRLDPATFGRLRTYVARGGGLIYFPGDRVDPQDFRRTFTLAGAASDSAGANRINVVPEGFLPGYPLALRTAADPLHFDPARANFEHPLLRRFARTDLAAASFSRLFTFEALDGTVPLRFDDGSPAILERAFGAGRIVVFASSASTHWNDMFLVASTAPLMLQAVYHCCRVTRHEELNRLVGEEVLLPFAFAAFDKTVVVTGPDGKETRVATRATPHGRSVATVPACDTPGIYTYRLEEAEDVGKFAINVDARESDTRPIDPNDVKDVLDNASVSLQGEDLLASSGWGTGDAWLILILLALAGLAAESWLANKDL